MVCFFLNGEISSVLYVSGTAIVPPGYILYSCYYNAKMSTLPIMSIIKFDLVAQCKPTGDATGIASWVIVFDIVKKKQQGG